MMMRFLIFLLLFWALPAAAGDRDVSVERGRYVVEIAGCNDCHTHGYAETNGNVGEDVWLRGDSLGWSGPWGTTYPVNLRLYMERVSEDGWLELARTITPRPPMPWIQLRRMTDNDLRSIYRFIRTLQPTGEPAPAWLPPGQKPSGPVIQFPD